MDQVQEIREKTDIVGLISEYIPLKLAGRNFKTACPFHNEKSPSFVISPERQIWHCFGCGKGGDVYTFLMEYEKMDFSETLRFLAKRTGIQLIQSETYLKTSSQKEELYELNRLASEFYHYILLNHPTAEGARKYLFEKRELTPKLIETFLIGFAPSVGNALTSQLIKKKSYNSESLIKAGLGYMRHNELRDFFINRIIFPLFDTNGNIVGFSGRVIYEESYGPKYINTKETMVYHKTKNFFGLNVTKQEIKSKNQAIIVEGEFDVISCFAQGISNVVAIKGTALTEDQVSLLSRFTNKVTLCLDQDIAGVTAVKRSLPILERKNMQVTVVNLGDAKDPDELIKKSVVVFKQAVKHDVSVYDFLLEKTLGKISASTAEGKKAIVDTLLPIVASIENEIVKEHYLKKLADAIDTSLESIQKEIERREKKDVIRLVVKGKNVVPIAKRSKKEEQEEYLLALLLQSPDYASSARQAMPLLESYHFMSPVYNRLYMTYQQIVNSIPTVTVGEFATKLPQELLPIFDVCYLLPISDLTSEERSKEIARIGTYLRNLSLRDQLKTLSKKLTTANVPEDDKQKTQREFNKISSMLKDL